ncbi:melatonin receptor type 1C-like [Nematostella vectensis]|uniref:melatonin receptor type 1C-like n=1 Tax=Nematostella vectensis TaxID=45351 RepID=UPI00207779A2|nr:melatonin receptor type 1C-like [Nematostella vectensis]
MEFQDVSAMFGTIAVLSVLGNAILGVVIARRRLMLKKTYNVLILDLAICDALTECPYIQVLLHFLLIVLSLGVFLVLTPIYIIPMKSFPVMSGGSGRAFCRAIFSTYCLFVCGKASNTTIMCLAIERWCAVVRPTKYKANFNRKRVSLYIALIWLAAAATEVFELFVADLMPDGRCEWITPFYGEELNKAFLVFHITITFYIPMTITWISFAHIWYRMSHNQVSTQQGDSTKKSVVRMCMLAALLLTLCWFPTETFWILKQYKVVVLPNVWYWVFNFFAFLNSCCNPPLYCLTNKTYRREVLGLPGCGKCGAEVAPENAAGQSMHSQSRIYEIRKAATEQRVVDVEESAMAETMMTSTMADESMQVILLKWQETVSYYESKIQGSKVHEGNALESKTKENKVQEEQGTGEQGTGEQGTGEQGTGEQGTEEQGTGEQGAGEQGTEEQGTGEQGTGEQGTGEQGTGEQGTGEQGTEEQGTSEQGTLEKGTGEQGTGEPGT